MRLRPRGRAVNQPDHRDYYIGRAAASRQLAQRAANPAIAAIHTDLAIRYERLAAQSDGTIDVAMAGVQAA